LNIASPGVVQSCGRLAGRAWRQQKIEGSDRGCERRAAAANRRLRLEIARSRDRSSRRELRTARRRQQVGATRPFECEHARGLEPQHVALRIEERFEFLGQCQLLDDDAVVRKPLRGGFGARGPSRFRRGARPASASSPTREGTQRLEARGAAPFTREHIGDERAVVDAAREESHGVEASGERLHRPH
jgi:hypothetical protein